MNKILFCLLAMFFSAQLFALSQKVPADRRYSFGGEAGRRIESLEKNWLLTAYDNNPEMVQQFIDRRWEGAHAVLPWNGEFPGKLLTGGADCWRLTRSKALKQKMLALAKDYISTIDADGYGGPFPFERRLSGWDSWGMYHCALGLFKWYRITGDRALLDACESLADYLLPFWRYEGEERKKMYMDGQGIETSQAWLHMYSLLYGETGKEEYLRAALIIVDDFALPYGGNYLNDALAGKEFYAGRKPRWESLHAVQGLASLFELTGDEKYRAALSHIWKSIMASDVHNTGAFSTFEQALGSPWKDGPIETCCVVAFNALTIDYLRLSGDPAAADALETALYNAVWGFQHPAGRWFTYDTPMNGMRKSASQDIVFQAREGAPDLNCCSVNAARGICSVGEWAFTEREGGVAVNYYGPVKARAGGFDIDVKGDYPFSEKVKIKIKGKKGRTVFFRIPAWSRNTDFRVNGKRLGCSPGTYLAADAPWEKGAQIDIVFDFSLRVLKGEEEKKGFCSVYAGPVLLAYDERYNDIPKDSPALRLETAERCRPEDIKSRFTGKAVYLPLLVYRAESDKGEVFLTDFATAGMAGNYYNSWLRTIAPGR
ncbi:MAG: glycoside hydrolase family 127 protein [Abditibacteriota bacterium]|nr:glycoside hydrolase family 127 protein [Abditibacteriota bacterium]